MRKIYAIGIGFLLSLAFATASMAQPCITIDQRMAAVEREVVARADGHLWMKAHRHSDQVSYLTILAAKMKFAVQVEFRNGCQVGWIYVGRKSQRAMIPPDDWKLLNERPV